MQNYMNHQVGQIRVTEARHWQCGLLQNRYELCEGQQLGHGTYGSVHKARNLIDNNYYALKKMEHFEDKSEMGFPITTIRQIKILQGLSHPNILNIREVVHQRARNHKPPVIYLCLDLMECDILELIKNQQYKITPFKIQHILRQVLTGLQYLHSHQISHRDIKPSNILINDSDNLKVADFGLAKKLKKLSTTKVVTLWYRAPELLLGVRTYSPKVDIWSLGCLAAQLILRRPLLQEASTQSEVLKKIFELTGTPDRYGWEEELLQQGKSYSQLKPNFSGESTIIYYLKERSTEFENEYELLDLIEKMMRLNHHSRLSATQCLAHPFFDIPYPRETLLTSDFLELREKQSEHEESGRKKVKI